MALLTPNPGGPGRRPSRRGAWPHALLIAATLFFPGGSIARAQNPAAREEQVKAVFLFNFAQFVEWPATAFTDARSPLIIGVLGDDPFDATLDAVVRGETVNGRPLTVRRYRRAEEIADCHILFISRSESDHFEEIFARLKGRNLLTVGDADGFGLRGGMILLVTENKKTRLRINLEAVKAAHLTISSKLLRPAEIIAPGKG